MRFTPDRMSSMSLHVRCDFIGLANFNSNCIRENDTFTLIVHAPSSLVANGL